jgi:hypothetical protein
MVEGERYFLYYSGREYQETIELNSMLTLRIHIILLRYLEPFYMRGSTLIIYFIALDQALSHLWKTELSGLLCLIQKCFIKK